MTNIIKKINGWQYIFLYIIFICLIYIKSVIRAEIRKKTHTVYGLLHAMCKE